VVSLNVRLRERGAVIAAATSQTTVSHHNGPKDFAALAPLQMMCSHCLIPDEAFERERLVIIEEIRRSEDNPHRRTFQRAMQIAFNHLPYRRPVPDH